MAVTVMNLFGCRFGSVLIGLPSIEGGAALWARFPEVSSHGTSFGRLAFQNFSLAKVKPGNGLDHLFFPLTAWSRTHLKQKSL